MERKRKILFFTIYDIWFDTKCFESSKCAITVLHTNDILDKKQYDFCQTTKTFLLDIAQEEQKIFSKFDYKSARYAINKAIRDGVSVHTVHTDEEKQQYLRFQKNFCAQRNIPCLKEEELKELCVYYALSAEEEYLGACAFIESADGTTVRYKYGATEHKLNANEIILWEAIKAYRRRGFHFFDFGGCVPTNDKESYYYRHYHFKKKFGGELIDTYTYFKTKGICRGGGYIFGVIINMFFKGDVNGFINWLYKKRILK